MVAFDCGFLTGENADTFPILICRDNRHGLTGGTCCERKDSTAHFIPLLVDSIKDLDFRRITLKCENEPRMKVLQEAMIHSCVGVSVRETKRQGRILRTSAEPNTSVRIIDDLSLLNWIPHFPIHFLNKMRTGRRWTKPMAQFAKQIWFHKIGEEGINSFVKRIIQGIFVGHHGRTGAILYIFKSGIVRGKSRTKQTLSDAWVSTNWKVLCQGSHMVIRNKIDEEVHHCRRRSGTSVAKNCGRDISRG